MITPLIFFPCNLAPKSFYFLFLFLCFCGWVGSMPNASSKQSRRWSWLLLSKDRCSDRFILQLRISVKATRHANINNKIIDPHTSLHLVWCRMINSLGILLIPTIDGIMEVGKDTDHKVLRPLGTTTIYVNLYTITVSRE